ncbi:hypothetical protein Y032_0024g1091 [Ancylostoma ceylanicum]|uniref:Chondroitin proteoglycan 4 domain-containing protein n=1 Tax=Ancylostoma ceylanicum TaxID=53326 RepID=A0A016UVL0_9BILA|nr:hypothetical protein Y032_0024g1091 [Ancylostoma ceylanicum]
MRLAWFVLLITLGGCLGMRPMVTRSFDLPVVIEASGLPHCARTCLSDLFLKAAELMTLKNPMEKFNDLCEIYNNASICVAEQEECFSETTFDFVFKGIDQLCNEKQEELKPHAECLEQKIEEQLNVCDESCGFTESLVTLSMKENVRQIARLRKNHEMMVWELSPVCTSTGCMTACIAEQLNTECGEPSGSIIVEALLKPFISSAIIVEELGPRAKMTALKQIPEECHYIIDREELDNIIKGIPPVGGTVTEGSGEEGSGEEGSGEGSGIEASGEEGSGMEASGEECSGEEPKPMRKPHWHRKPFGGRRPRPHGVPQRPMKPRPEPRKFRPQRPKASFGDAKGIIIVAAAGSARGARVERSALHSHSHESEERLHMTRPRPVAQPAAPTTRPVVQAAPATPMPAPAPQPPRPMTQPVPPAPRPVTPQVQPARPRPVHRDSRDSRDSMEMNRVQRRP